MPVPEDRPSVRCVRQVVGLFDGGLWVDVEPLAKGTVPLQQQASELLTMANGARGQTSHAPAFSVLRLARLRTDGGARRLGNNRAATGRLGDACVAQYKATPWKCLFRAPIPTCFSALFTHSPLHRLTATCAPLALTPHSLLTPSPSTPQPPSASPPPSPPSSSPPPSSKNTSSASARGAPRRTSPRSSPTLSRALGPPDTPGHPTDTPRTLKRGARVC